MANYAALGEDILHRCEPGSIGNEFGGGFVNVFSGVGEHQLACCFGLLHFSHILGFLAQRILGRSQEACEVNHGKHHGGVEKVHEPRWRRIVEFCNAVEVFTEIGVFVGAGWFNLEDAAPECSAAFGVRCFFSTAENESFTLIECCNGIEHEDNAETNHQA